MTTEINNCRRVLSIQSHVVRGYVGNKSATFPLQVKLRQREKVKLEINKISIDVAISITNNLILYTRSATLRPCHSDWHCD